MYCFYPPLRQHARENVEAQLNKTKKQMSVELVARERVKEVKKACWGGSCINYKRKCDTCNMQLRNKC